MIPKMDPAKLEQLGKEEYCYLTTKGRVSGKPHRIEIWFGMQGATAYLLSGGGAAADWVKNLKVEPKVEVRIGKNKFAARARLVTVAAEDTTARQLLAAKYYHWRPGRKLNSWARTALPVALDFASKRSRWRNPPGCAG